MYVQVDGGILRQQRVAVAAHADDGHLHVEYHGDETQQLVGKSRVADGKDYIVACHHAQVAVKDVKGVDEEGRSACTGQRSGDFRTDVSALAHACDDDFSVTAIDKFYCSVEVGIETRDEVKHGLCFFADDLYGVIFGGHWRG